MSARQVYRIECDDDGDGCEGAFVAQSALLGAAREQAALAGWSHDFRVGDSHAANPADRYGRSRDYCPRCTAELAGGAT